MKGKAAKIGDVHTWGGKQFIKTGHGWEPYNKKDRTKKEDDQKKRLSAEQLATHAENTSHGQLKKVVSDSNREHHIRDAAQREIERRKEEKDKGKPKPEPKKEEPVEDTKELQDYTLGYAPFREGKIKNISDGSKAFQEKSYQNWKDMAHKFAEAIGIKITEDNETIGIYGDTSANAEASALPRIKGNPEQVELFAALMGTLAPDKQHSVMTLGYDKNGTTSEHRITFKDSGAAEKFVKNRADYGIQDVSLIPSSNTVVVLEFEGSGFNKEKLFEDYGQQIKGVKERKVNARFIGQDEYAGIVRKARSQARGRNGKISGGDFSDVLRLAHERASGNEEVAKPKKTKKDREKAKAEKEHKDLYGGDFENYYSKMAAKHADFSKLTHEIAAMVGGDPIVAPVKSKERSKAKVEKDYNGDFSRLKDVLRSTIVVKDPAQIKEKVATLFDTHSDKIEKFFVDFDSTGYQGANVVMRMGGAPVEVQFNTPINLALKDPASDNPLVQREIQALKEHGVAPGFGHKFYDQLRKLPSGSDDYKKVEDKMNKYYSFRNYFR